ncbi:MAG: NAD(P)-dependent oxidoreductase [Chloroflexi bacterium]|nr:NAD(P)-dependent oxidoreductase [Chloroflexota bacterium]
MTNYLVIGGTGIMGHFLTRQLVGQRHNPVVLTVSGDTSMVRDIVDRVRVVQGDVTDGEELARVVKEFGITHIAHLGAFLEEEDPQKSVRVNVEGMVNVLEAARRHGVKRVVYTSTKSVYGPITGDYGHPTYRPLPEDYPTRPTTVYGITKLAGEYLGRRYQQRYGLEFVALRFGSTVGPGKLRHGGPFVFHSRMIENAMLGRPTQIPRGGEAANDTVYDADAAQGILHALQAPAPGHSAYHIGTGYGITLRDFARAVTACFPEAEIQVGPGASFLSPDLPTNYCVLDIALARGDLGYEPRYTPGEMVRDYVSTMERLGLAPTPT